MRHKVLRYSIVWSMLLLILLSVSCRRTRPQIQSNRPDTDSVAIALLELNQRYVTESANQMAFYVNAGTLPYVLDDMGYWYYIREKSQGQLASEQPILQLHQQIYLLDRDSTLCEDATIEVRLGKKEMLEAVEMCLEHVRIGEKVSILAPWYYAYGQKGNGEQILPYTSLRIELAILE